MSLSREETLSQVIEIVADKLNMDVSDISEESDFKSLGADSLDIAELIMSFEETFGIEINDDDAEKIASIGEAATRIHELISE